MKTGDTVKIKNALVNYDRSYSYVECQTTSVGVIDGIFGDQCHVFIYPMIKKGKWWRIAELKKAKPTRVILLENHAIFKTHSIEM
jgi:hypothetical protein